MMTLSAFYRNGTQTSAKEASHDPKPVLSDREPAILHVDSCDMDSADTNHNHHRVRLGRATNRQRAWKLPLEMAQGAKRIEVHCQVRVGPMKVNLMPT